MKPGGTADAPAGRTAGDGGRHFGADRVGGGAGTTTEAGPGKPVRQVPRVRARQREDWGIPDPKELPPAEFNKVRDLIEARVKDLLARL